MPERELIKPCMTSQPDKYIAWTVVGYMCTDMNCQFFGEPGDKIYRVFNEQGQLMGFPHPLGFADGGFSFISYFWTAEQAETCITTGTLISHAEYVEKYGDQSYAH